LVFWFRGFQLFGNRCVPVSLGGAAALSQCVVRAAQAVSHLSDAPPAELNKQIDSTRANWADPSSQADRVVGRIVPACICQPVANKIVAVQKAAQPAAKQ
jgi:hypothetical protein